MLCAAGYLGFLAARTDILFADGLRYIDQARHIERGDLPGGLLGAVDHPAYPAAIALARHGVGMADTPEAWQAASQWASGIAGVLLVIPLYLIALELVGAPAAWLAVAITFLIPLTGHVLADTLSEGTFLLFWSWGVWAALRFLRQGAFGWLVLSIGFGALAYLTRPEGLLLPLALAATLVLMPLLPATRMNWPRWWAAVGFLVIGPAILVGPYVALKGGVGTKPAVRRLLGLEGKSPALAVERERPLDPNQSAVKTYALAARAVVRATLGAATLPVLVLVPIGIVAAWPRGGRARPALLIGIVLGASALALMRLHATGGYCTPRHAMLLAYPLIVAGANGLNRLLGAIAIPARRLGLPAEEGKVRLGPIAWLVALVGFGLMQGRGLAEPIGGGFGGYKDAGRWVAEHVPVGRNVVDVTGWSHFYGRRGGYTFANLGDAARDPNVRWVVVREAHLRGPWGYCRQLREMVGALAPEVTFPAQVGPGISRVLVFDRGERGERVAEAASRVRR